MPFVPTPRAPATNLRQAYAWCERLARSHYENFPVGSMLLAPRLRRHVWAIYAFARLADDFADESAWAGRRLEHLAHWRRQLDACVRGRASHPVFIALAHTIDRYDLPVALLHDLITAFEMDCTATSWPDWSSLLTYSRYSANPVGRLVLWLHGYRDDARARRSDCICTALQLANFWQDVGVDLLKGRAYIPEAEMARFGYSRHDLDSRVLDQRLRDLMADLVARTDALFAAGANLPQRVEGLLRFELRLTWLGGRAILAAVRGNDYNVFLRPTLGRRQWLKLLLKALI
jgi:phytoene synthase